MKMRGAENLVVLLTLALVVQSDAARILGLFPIPGKSHMITFSAITRELAERGHELVVVSTFPLKDPPPTYTDIDTWKTLRPAYEEMVHTADIWDFDDISKVFLPLIYWEEGRMTMELTFSDPDVKILLNDTRGFDLVIAEDFACDAIFAFANYFKAPLVLISSLGGFHVANHAVGSPFNPSYAVNNLLEMSDRKTFYERVVNNLFTWHWDLSSYFFHYPVQDKLKDEFFGPGLPSTSELRYSASLVLVNNHFSLNYPRPLTPNFVEVGGMHVKPAKGILPADMKKWLDEAEHGAIYFSMGSNLRIDQMAEDKRNAFLTALSELKQRVIWKCESEAMPWKPENVMFTDWAPQMEILAHPNMKLFITHGGLLGGQEAMYNGVPIVGIPVFGDQRMNVQRAVNEGYGVMLSIKNITRESVLEAINKGLNDKSIRAEVKRRQSVYLDQPQSPLERAVFWTEYVLRHKGAPHMRSAAVDLAWYQLHLLDVYAFLISILLGGALLTRCACKCICSKFCSKKEIVSKNKKNK